MPVAVAGCSTTACRSSPSAVVHRIGFKVLASRLARVGEPFVGFFDPAELVAAVERAGVVRVDDLASSDLTLRFLSNRTDGLRLSGLGHILCARA